MTHWCNGRTVRYVRTTTLLSLMSPRCLKTSLEIVFSVINTAVDGSSWPQFFISTSHISSSWILNLCKAIMFTFYWMRLNYRNLILCMPQEDTFLTSWRIRHIHRTLINSLITLILMLIQTIFMTVELNFIRVLFVIWLFMSIKVQ